MIKSVSTTRLKDAKYSLIHQKKSLADLNRQENIQLKQAKSLSKAKQEDINRVFTSLSRVVYLKFSNTRSLLRIVAINFINPKMDNH